MAKKYESLEAYRASHIIYQPVTTHPEKFWAAVPKGSIDPQVDMITAGDKDTIDWILEVNYKTWLKKTADKPLQEKRI